MIVKMIAIQKVRTVIPAAMIIMKVLIMIIMITVMIVMFFSFKLF